MRKSKQLLQLFLNMLYISTFTFGGGFVIATFMKQKFVDELHWIEEEEMLDMIALAQSSPGAIAVNCAIMVGWKIGGGMGMVVSVLGTIIPPMLILIVLSFFYEMFVGNPHVVIFMRGMQAGVAAVIMNVAADLAIHVVRQKRMVCNVIMIAAFAATYFGKVNVILIILIAAFIGIVLDRYHAYRSNPVKKSNSDREKVEK